MREIKFRAWNKEENTMIFPEDSSCYFELSDTGLSILDMTIEPDDLGFAHIDATIMQYTGLKDKNGIEIYEGDVVVIRYSKNGHSFIEQIHCENGVFMAGDEDWLYNIRDYCEVIGNIHEHPELLND